MRSTAIITTNELPLTIKEGPLDEMLRLASSTPNTEFVGLLTAGQGEPILVNGFLLLPAETTGSSATATGMAIRSAIQRLQAAGDVPVGVFHSHGRHGVFHSATDDRMISRLFPMLAAGSMQPLRGVFEPQLLDQDHAQLAMPDGRVLNVRLRGQDFGIAHERGVWQFVRTAFHDLKSPHIAYSRRVVDLVGQRTSMQLGVPDTGAVEITTSLMPARSATLHSLVVNAKGDTFVEWVKIFDIKGFTFIKREPTGIERVRSESPKPAPNRHFMLYREQLPHDADSDGGTLTHVWNGEDDVHGHD